MEFIEPYVYAKIVDDKVVEWPLMPIEILKNNNLWDSSVIGDKHSKEQICIELGYTRIPISPKKYIQESHNQQLTSELYKDENGVWQVRYILKSIDENSDEYRTRLNRQWEIVRNKRNKLLQATDFRVLQAMTGKNPDEDLNALESYRQELANITDQLDPFNIIWPDEV